MYETPLLPSQFMRMLLARRLGLLEKFDWREYPGQVELDTFLSTLRKSGYRRASNVFKSREASDIAGTGVPASF